VTHWKDYSNEGEEEEREEDRKENCEEEKEVTNRVSASFEFGCDDAYDACDVCDRAPVEHHRSPRGVDHQSR
jgi:hypothetical protein